MDRRRWKSVASGSTDKVIAWSDKKENLFDEVSYQSLNGDVPKQKSENGVEITVTSSGHEQVSEIEAYSTDGSKENEKTVIGRLNVISYDPIVRNLVLVPVNGATIPSHVSLTNELNKIFGPAIVTWNIKPGENIDVGLGSDGKLDDGSSGLLSNYTQEMREVIRAYKSEYDITDETYYLFFVGSGETGTKDGYMPRKKQCGFIFTENLRSENLIKTIAHELAHGAFRLEHSFETYPALPKGTTDNLMDYSVGTRLHKYQWDLIHNPVAVWGLFEGDEEGASFCTWWHQNISSYFNPSDKDKKLAELSSLFHHMQENFEKYYESIKKEDTEAEGFKHWSVRKASLDKSKKTNLIPIESVFKKLVDGKTDDFNAYDQGIFLGQYRIENRDFNVAVYSTVKKFGVDKVKVEDLCDLVDHEVIKIIIEDEYVLISFFKGAELKMVIQIDEGDDETAKLWLKYLGILVEGPSMVEQIKAYWNSLWESEESSEVEEIFLNDVEWVSQFDSRFATYTCWPSQCCYQASLAILASKGLSTDRSQQVVIAQSTSGDCGSLSSTNNFKKGIEIIDKSLSDHKLPILIGVHHPKKNNSTQLWYHTCSGNTPSITNHYVVIVGSGYDESKKKRYYRFYEVGTSYQDKGTSTENRLFIDEASELVIGNTKYVNYQDGYFTITEVRKNIGQSYE